MKKLETKSMVLLKHHWKALRMPTMHAECEKVAARCARDNVAHLGFLLQLCELDLLVLDELGYVPTSQLGAELLFDVISTACERTSVIVTTNLPFEQWTEVLGSERLTGAVLDRLTHRGHILEAPAWLMRGVATFFSRKSGSRWSPGHH